MTLHLYPKTTTEPQVVDTLKMLDIKLLIGGPCIHRSHLFSCPSVMMVVVIRLLRGCCHRYFHYKIDSRTGKVGELQFCVKED